MKFELDHEDIEVLPVKIADKEFIRIHLKKEDVPETERDIFYNLADKSISYDADGEVEVEDKDTLKCVEAVADALRSVPEYVNQPLIELQRKANETEGDRKLLAVGTAAGLVIAAVGIPWAASAWYGKGFNKGHDAGYGDGVDIGVFEKDRQLRQDLENRIMGNFPADKINATEQKLFKKDIRDLSEELSHAQLIDLQNALVEQRTLENTDVAEAFKNSVYELILANTSFNGTQEDLQAMNMGLLGAVAFYGELKMKDVVTKEAYALGKRHGQQDILNQTGAWNKTNYDNGLNDGKILGSADLYNQAVDFVTWILSQEDVGKAAGNIRTLLNLYTQTLEDYTYSLTKWTADFTTEVSGQDNTAAEEALDRIASLGPEYRVTVDNGTKYMSWYANLTNEDAAEIENTTGASVQEWYNHGYGFELTDTFGDGAILKMYQGDNTQMFKVSQDLYDRQKVWEKSYEGE